MKVAVIGCGSMGTKHIKHLMELGQEVSICDINPERLRAVAEKHRVSQIYTSHAELAEKETPRAVVIATDTAFHASIARFFAERGVDYYSEIPINDSLKELQELVTVSISKGVISMVGMVWRFHPAIKKIKELLKQGAVGKVNTVAAYGGDYLPDWHPGAPYKTEYSALRAKGGGVIITNISGVDYLRYFFGEVESAFCVYDSISHIGIEAEDFFMAILQFQNGVFSQLYSDFFQKPCEHMINIVGDKGRIRWNHAKDSVDICSYVPADVTGEKDAWVEHRYKLDDFWALYKEEMQHFLGCVERHERTCIPVEDNVKTVAVAEAMKRSMHNRAMVNARGLLWEG